MHPRFNIQINSSDTLPEIPTLARTLVCLSGYCLFGSGSQQYGFPAQEDRPV